MNTVIRAMTKADIPALLRLVEEYWIFEDIAGFDPARLTKELERLVGNPALGNGWIAWAGHDAAAYLIAVYVFSLEHLGLTAEIDEFFVLPSLRGRDIGSELLKMAEGEFIHRGCTNVSLQLGRENHRARAFYRRNGYSEREGFELLDKMLPQG